MSFIVYMHTTPNKKRYIGITQQEAESVRQKGYDRKHLYVAVKEKRKAYGCFWEVENSPHFKRGR